MINSNNPSNPSSQDGELSFEEKIRRCSQATHEGRVNTFNRVHYDPVPIPAQKKSVSLSSLLLFVSCVILSCFVLFLLSDRANLTSEVTELAEKNTSLTEQNLALIEERDDLVSKVFHMEAIQSYPENGSVIIPSTAERLAPLTIETSGDDAYYIKLVNVINRLSEFAFFVQPGQTVEIDAPLGRYYLYYATGKKWYGKEEVFGPETQFYKADDTFYFYYDSGYYNGYTVTLYDVPGGNLGYDSVSELEFSLGI